MATAAASLGTTPRSCPFPERPDTGSIKQALEWDSGKCLVCYVAGGEEPVLLSVFHQCKPKSERAVPPPESMAYLYAEISSSPTSLAYTLPNYLASVNLSCHCNVDTVVRGKFPDTVNPQNSWLAGPKS